MSFAAFDVSDLDLPSSGDLDTSTYPLNLMFQETLETVDLQFFDEQFSTPINDSTKMVIQDTEILLSSAQDENNANSQLQSVDSLDIPSSPAEQPTPLDFSTAKDQDTVSSDPAMSPQLSGSQSSIGETMDNHELEPVSGEKDCASRSLECVPQEHHRIDRATNDQVSGRPDSSTHVFPPRYRAVHTNESNSMDEYCGDEARHRALLTVPLKLPRETSMGENLAVPEVPTADIYVPESGILVVVETHSGSSGYNEAENVAEKAQIPSGITAVDGDTPSPEESTLFESPRPECSDPGLVNTRSSTRLATKNKRSLEDDPIIISSDSDGDKDQKSARCKDTLKRRKVQKGLAGGSNVFKVPRFSAHSALHNKPATRSSQQDGNAVRYNMGYHPIDEFMRPAHPRKKPARVTKEGPGNESSPIDNHSELLRLERRMDEVMITCGIIQTLAERQNKLLEELISKSP